MLLEFGSATKVVPARGCTAPGIGVGKGVGATDAEGAGEGGAEEAEECRALGLALSLDRG
jgi:hypothetical protein